MGSNDDDPVAAVRGAKGRRRYAVPPAIEPARGQVTEHLGEAVPSVQSNEVCDILHHDVSGSKLANASGHLPPKDSLGMAETGAFPGAASPLTREAASDDVDPLAILSDGSNIVIDGNSGPAPSEDASAELVGLAEPSVFEPGEVEAVVEESDAAEERADIQGENRSRGTLPPSDKRGCVADGSTTTTPPPALHGGVAPAGVWMQPLAPASR